MNVLVNVLCSLLASFIFIFVLLYCFKPKIRIVTKIAKKDVSFDDRGMAAFMFKIVNKSVFPAYEIKAQLSSYKIIQGENEIIDKHYTHLKLRNDNVSHLQKKKLFGKENGENCVVFLTYEDIQNMLGDENTNIQFLVSAKHGLTGLSHIFKYTYTTKNCVEEGKFKSGDCDSIC